MYLIYGNQKKKKFLENYKKDLIEVVNKIEL